MIPLPQILAELIMALGAALFGASVLALVRPSGRAGSGEPPQVRARGKVVVNVFIGLLVFVWGFASFLARAGS